MKSAGQEPRGMGGVFRRKAIGFSPATARLSPTRCLRTVEVTDVSREEMHQRCPATAEPGDPMEDAA